jgi:predicted metalloprotease with PDZ domain
MVKSLNQNLTKRDASSGMSALPAHKVLGYNFFVCDESMSVNLRRYSLYESYKIAMIQPKEGLFIFTVESLLFVYIKQGNQIFS